MKTPKIAFSKDQAIGFVLNHGEKVIVAIFGLAACGLAWGGVTALRTMTPSADQQPKAIITEAATTAEHIDAVKIAPEAELTAEKGLAATVARWLSPKVVPPPPHTDFNKPLFRELAKRGSPEILPVEDLRTFAGLAIVAVKSKGTPSRLALDRPAEPAGPQRPGKPPRGGRNAPPPAPPEMPPPARPDAPQTQGKIMPYVIVTGLIPVGKQREEFDARFKDASLRDPVADAPAWISYQIEKTEVIPDAAEKWMPVDIKAVARKYSSDWAGLFSEPLQQVFALAPDQERRDPATIPIPFCSPLPQVIDRPWGFDALHPWFVEYLRRQVAARRAEEEKLRRQAEESGTVFGAQNSAPGGPAAPGFMPGMPLAGPPGEDGGMAQGPEYRMFRFLDFAVVPGRTYRYRVQVTCGNPNHNVNSRHLADASLAKAPTLASPASEPTAPTLVPDGIRMLVQPLPKDQIKKLKGMVEISILGPNPEGGALSLRTMITEVGGIANVDPQLNKKSDPRSRGDAILTDRVLLDVRGRLEDRGEARPGRPTPPAEPLEMIFLRPDGTFDVASAADSQDDLTRYKSPEGGEATSGDPGRPPRGEATFGNPFAPQK